jgi:hypothetical protein
MAATGGESTAARRRPVVISFHMIASTQLSHRYLVEYASHDALVDALHKLKRIRLDNLVRKEERGGGGSGQGNEGGRTESVGQRGGTLRPGERAQLHSAAACFCCPGH